MISVCWSDWKDVLNKMTVSAHSERPSFLWGRGWWCGGTGTYLHAKHCALPLPHRCEKGIVIRLLSGRGNPV